MDKYVALLFVSPEEQEIVIIVKYYEYQDEEDLSIYTPYGFTLAETQIIKGDLSKFPLGYELERT